jgi:hypothetical protein
MRLMEAMARPFRKLAPSKRLRFGRFEDMLAAGETLQEALATRVKCRRICFADRSEAGMERCRRCAASIERGQELYDQAALGLRGLGTRESVCVELRGSW